MNVERHELYEQDTAAYLLGALSEEESTRFVRHLMECPVCRDEMERLQVAVDALPRSVTPLAAPAALKEAVMAEVREGEVAAVSAPGRLVRLLRAGGRRFPAGAVAVLAAGLVLGFGASRLADGGGSDGRTVSAKFDGVPHASGNLVIGSSDADAEGTLRVHGMPSLGRDQTYQVWLRRDGEMIPKALFTVSQDGDGLTAVDGRLDDAQAVLVTREPTGGSRAPTGSPVLTVGL